MTNKATQTPDADGFGQELKALKTVLDAVNPLGEEARAFVFRTAAERLNIMSVEGGPAKTTATQISSSDSLDGVTPKEFLREKKPNSELQRMVCLGFFLANARDKAHFKTIDLTNLNTEAAGGKFSNASATVRNATNQSHFFAPAGKGGLKQMTALGEDFVNALPDQAAAKTAIAANKAGKRKPTKRRRAKSKP